MNLSLNWISKDGKLLLTARIMRTFGYGFLSVIIAIYLRLLGFDNIQIGLLLGTALVNSVIFTLFASFYADRIGRRRLLIIYASLMSISGLVFTITDNYFLLIFAAFIGTINVTGSETGAFLTIEQATLPQTITNKKMMNTAFALFNMLGTFAMSVGILLSSLPSLLQEQFNGLSEVESIKSLFILYSILGLVVIIIYIMLSRDIEVKHEAKRKVKQTLSPRSKQIVAKLSTLFAIDSFAGGFVIQSVISLWFFSRFGADLVTLSYIFSAANIITGLSYIGAAKIADRIGLVNTMVFTHLPSNILLILVAFAPSLQLAVILYLIRMTLSQMDVPTRQSYIVAIVSEDERTAASGLTNVSRNIAQTVSPSIFGYIFQSSLSLAAPFVLGGVIKIIYDLALYFNFRNIKPKDE
ncbi:MAG TPA: MFS transporter [Nitrososphaeraceae archaeon]|nr:MFS transporter [Nitrososphaeraceae archaeon]